MNILYSTGTTFSSTIIAIAFLLLSVVVGNADASTLDQRQAPLMCPICRSNDRPLLNPSHSFTMSNGITWTCEYLQETVQDVNQHGQRDEQTMCATAQLQAEEGGCQCGGAYMQPLSAQYTDVNPKCNLCEWTTSNAGVPSSNYDKLVDTQIIGVHNCKGLYDAMAEGIVSSSLCPDIQRTSGQTCCEITSHLRGRK